MANILEYFTPARLVYWLLTFNLAVLAVLLFKRELVNVIVKHKKRAQGIFAFGVIILLIYIHENYLYY